MYSTGCDTHSNGNIVPRTKNRKKIPYRYSTLLVVNNVVKIPVFTLFVLVNEDLGNLVLHPDRFLVFLKLVVQVGVWQGVAHQAVRHLDLDLDGSHNLLHYVHDVVCQILCPVIRPFTVIALLYNHENAGCNRYDNGRIEDGGVSAGIVGEGLETDEDVGINDDEDQGQGNAIDDDAGEGKSLCSQGVVDVLVKQDLENLRRKILLGHPRSRVLQLLLHLAPDPTVETRKLGEVLEDDADNEDGGQSVHTEPSGNLQSAQKYPNATDEEERIGEPAEECEKNIVSYPQDRQRKSEGHFEVVTRKIEGRRDSKDGDRDEDSQGNILRFRIAYPLIQPRLANVF
mmetsp:Transcript_7975/g.18484  ORF Transcript_7975/g.18484 Transcript_7975/m.18484 type:complete len:342 (-) Transcript_7975:1339-2364(-)